MIKKLLFFSFVITMATHAEAQSIQASIKDYQRVDRVLSVCISIYNPTNSRRSVMVPDESVRVGIDSAYVFSEYVLASDTLIYQPRESTIQYWYSSTTRDTVLTIKDHTNLTKQLRINRNSNKLLYLSFKDVDIVPAYISLPLRIIENNKDEIHFYHLSLKGTNLRK